MLRGNLPRSPVWLRKIPSTVSGSQGSRRGLRPAVRFAFPLGAKMYITDFPAPGQGKVRIRAELFRRAGGFRRIVGVSPGRTIVTDGPLQPILVEESPQPGRSGAMREGSERSSPRAMSATRPRAIRAPLLAPLQKQPFPPTRIGHSRHHMPANRAIAFSPIRPPPADLRSIRADRGLSEGAGRGRQHDRGAEHVRGIGHKAQLQRHSEAVPPRQAHGGGVSEGRRLREPDGALPPRSTGPPRDGRSALSAASSRDRRPFAVDLPMRPGKAPIAGHAFLPGGKADSGGFPHKKWAPARANAQNRTRFSSHRPQWARPPRRGHARARLKS